MVLVSGSLAYDRIMNFPGRFRDHIMPEKLHALSVSFLIDRVDRHFGGTAGNIAYSLALLGEPATIIAGAGRDFSPYKTWLRARGIPTASIAVHTDIDTASATIMTDREDNQITGFHLGAMGRRMENAKIKMKKYATTATMAIVSPGNIDDMRTLPRIYKKHKIPYLYDPGQQIPALSAVDLRAGISSARALIVNDYELALVEKKTGWGKAGILKKTAMLVTTLGAKGSVIEVESRKSKVIKHAIPAAKPKAIVDPTGAGDAYRAGFLYGLTAGWPLEVVGRFAALIAVYTVECVGTQTHTLTWSGLRRRYRAQFGSRIP